MYEVRLGDGRRLASLLLLAGGSTAQWSQDPNYCLRFPTYADANAIASILVRAGAKNVRIYHTYTQTYQEVKT